MVDVKLRSVLRGFLTVSAPPLVLLLLLILAGKGQVVGGEVKEGPLESIHLNIRVIFDLTLHCLYVLCLPGKSRRRKVVVIGVLSGWRRRWALKSLTIGDVIWHGGQVSDG